MANWKSIKQEVEAELTSAGIDLNSEAAKVILRLERRINSTRNLVGKNSWEYVCNSTPYNEATALLELLSPQDGRNLNPKYINEWTAYCKANNYCVDAYIGDYLA